MLRTLAVTLVSALLATAVLGADTPRKKDVIEPPAPEKPNIEPPKETPKPAPPRPKAVKQAAQSATAEKSRTVKQAPAPVSAKPAVEPAKPAKTALTRSPFTSPEPPASANVASAKKVAAEKKGADNPPGKKPVAEKPRIGRKPNAGGYVHAVTIPLRKDAPSDIAEQMVVDCHGLLGKIPSVRAVKAGRPAEKHSPDYVKTDYSVGLVVFVDDHEGLKAYLDHPRHIQFVEKYKKFIDFEHLRVFDFADGQ